MILGYTALRPITTTANLHPVLKPVSPFLGRWQGRTPDTANYEVR
jgi:hypothetical protein